jgi:uncharacterized membrane protein
MIARMKRIFFAGLVTLLPLAVTIAIVSFFIRILTQPFLHVVTQLISSIDLGLFSPLKNETTLRLVSQLLILIGIFFSIVLLGVVARWFFFNALLRTGDRILQKIPLVNTIYKTTRDIIQTLFTADNKSLQQVVLVPFPCPGSWCLGLIAQQAPRSVSAARNEAMISVFIPTAPNPTAGFLTMSPDTELLYLDMRTEDAIKYIVSAGVIPPGRESPLGGSA